MNYKLIKESRLALGLTQKQVAFELGMTHGSYRNFETGLRGINTAKLVKLVKLLNISFEEVLNV